MKVLLDTNVVLDVLLAREPWLADAKAIWEACDGGSVDGFLLASTLRDIFYIARRLVGREAAREAVTLCVATFTLCPVDRAVIERALLFSGPDFEDDVQIAAALLAEMDALITRNPADFAHSRDVVILTPADCLARLAHIAVEDASADQGI